MATERVALCRTERWDFAQRYAAIEMMKQGGGLTISAVLDIYTIPLQKIAMLWV
jgi:hypothetical protein